MADEGVVADGKVLGEREEGEGVAGGVVGGDVVVGERGGWSSRGVDGRAGDNSVQRGRTDGTEASAQSITIAHGMWTWYGMVRSWKNAVAGMRAAAAQVDFVVRCTRRNQEFPLSEQRPTADARTPCKACRSY